MIFTQDEIEYYRLELTNREKNFNKIFNSHPIVGNIQSFKSHNKVNINNINIYKNIYRV